MSRAAITARRRVQLAWSVVSFEQAVISRPDGRSILIQIGVSPEGEYGALAVEGATDTLGTDRVIDDHGHKIIGRFTSEAAAKRAAEAFAKEWLVSGVAVEACSCEEILPARAAKTAGQRLHDEMLKSPIDLPRRKRAAKHSARNARAA